MRGEERRRKMVFGRQKMRLGAVDLTLSLIVSRPTLITCFSSTVSTAGAADVTMVLVRFDYESEKTGKVQQC